MKTKTVIYDNEEFIICGETPRLYKLRNLTDNKKIINHTFMIYLLEKYFKDQGCEYVLVDVFAYNKNAIKFYDKKGYHPRMYIDIKKLGD